MSPRRSHPCTRPFKVDRQFDACETEIEGYKVKFVPPDPSKAVSHLAVYFHGDTGEDWEKDYGYDQLADCCYKNNVLLLAALSEAWNTDGTDSWRVWWRTESAGTQSVVKIIDTFKAAYQPTSDSVFYSGASGGSQYLTGTYLPQVGDAHPGIMALNCGGAQPRNFSWDTADPELQARFSFFFNYGDQDFLADQANNTFLQLGKLGFETDRSVVAGADHCALTIQSDEKTIEFWQKHL